MKAAGVLRPPGLVIFAVVVLLIGLLYWLFADRIVKGVVEATGESLVGARVELESVDLRVTEGSVRMTGLQVANPNAPMTNLMEAGEIAVDLLLGPLLEKKVVVQNLVVTGVRFGTPREESGALEDPPPGSGALWERVSSWADAVELPELSFDALTGVVRTEALDADSLRTVQYARQVAARADSLRGAWEERLASLDPRPRIDSLRSVVERLEQFQPSPANAAQVPGLLDQGRQALSSLTSLQTEVGALDDAVREGLTTIDVGPETLAELREADLAYARGLLDLPSLDAPSISPAIFGETALAWLTPVLFWVHTAEQYLPPGLDPRRRPGPRRARAEGITVEFPGRARYPSFWLQEGELGLEIGGGGLAAGAYSARVSGISTAPSLTGEPMAIQVGREQGVEGPTGLSLAAVLDHTSEVVRDSVALDLAGVTLPEIDLPGLGGGLDLGAGETSFSLRREGDQLDARLEWTSTDVSWLRPDAPAGGAAPAVGTAAWAEDLVWRTLAGIERVELAMGLEGDISSPSVSVESNLGQAVADALRRELGAQIEEAEARLREEVDARVQPLVQDARARVEAIQTGVAEQVGAQRQELEQLHAQLEQRIAELTSGLPGGLPGLPNLPGLPGG
ncbi:MAG TPA: TIGR03545 family protein [Longimicrobiales bacterium]|nr:TIGR03545 family protein [Longimicrobiales bacterium]